VAIEHRSPHRPEAWAQVTRRVGPRSPDRVVPACPGFGRCGGCAWQHLAYPAQLAAKRQRVVDALAAALPDPPAVEAIVASPAQLGYRNKGKYVVGTIDGRTVLGSYKPRTHELVDMAGCRVVDPHIDRAVGAVRGALAATGLAPHDERSRTGVLRYVVLRADAAGRVLALIVTTSAAPRQPLVSAAVALIRHGLHGVLWSQNDATSGTILGDAPELLDGSAALTETIAGVTIDVSATEFLQVNRGQAERLYAAVAERSGAGPGTRAIELYSGVGGIAFALARAGAQIMAIESSREAVAAGRIAAAAADLAGKIAFHAGDAGTAATLAAGFNPDLVVVDPPRKGLDDATHAAIAALPSARTLAYVSCSPESLGRDLARLHQAGWRPESALPFDLMPGTAQVETMIVCQRARENE
jgi:23S rRNA (uracil1939-C5)-methyltransferase